MTRRTGKLPRVISAKRFYPVRQMPTTEAGIKTLGLSQLYISLGDSGKDGSVVVRVWWKPLVTLIWLGGLVMMTGAAVSLLRPPASHRRAGTPPRCWYRKIGSERGMSMALRTALIALFLSIAPAGPALAVLPGEMLSDPALEARARALSSELRCMVCRESVDR